MGYHAINEGSNIPVYWQSICTNDALLGTLYNGEVFTFIKESSYQGNYEIRFLSSEGAYRTGFINEGQYGNLVFSGTKVNDDKIGSCYRFTLRKALNVVDNSGKHHISLATGDYIYSNSATAGASNKANMGICGYKHNNTTSKFDGFVTLDYTGGSMFATNFCLKK
jgi:hypothetical protein